MSVFLSTCVFCRRVRMCDRKGKLSRRKKQRIWVLEHNLLGQQNSIFPSFFFLKYFAIPCGKFGSPYGAQQPQEQCYQFLSVCAVFLCDRTIVWLPVLGFFNLCTYGDACDCIWGLYRHWKTICTGSRLLEKKSLAPQGDLNPSQYCAWLFNLTLYQLSCPGPYIIIVSPIQ